LAAGLLVSNGFLTANPDCPFGGRKASGIGREYGPEGFSEFLEYKTVNLPVSRAAG
jgi:acyl-CoA reductase-like NAD-dependent aldehyde dehydrogenase